MGEFIPLFYILITFKVSFISFVSKPPLFMRSKWQNMTTFFAVTTTFFAVSQQLFLRLQQLIEK
jgi:hypothetical protein